MIRIQRFAAVALLILAGTACALRAGTASAPRPWSQCEIARALRSEELRLDPAARLTVSQSYGKALDALGQSTDSLRAGILAFKADKPEAAIGLLSGRFANPYLEWFRLYYRAAALCSAKRYGESQSALDTLRMSAAGVVGPSWPMFGEARDLSAEVVARSDSLLRAKGVPAHLSLLSSGSLVLVSEALLARGMDSVVADAWEHTGERLAIPSSLLAEFLNKLQPLYPRLSPRLMRRLAVEALAADLDADAARIIRSMLRRNAKDYDALICKGFLYESTNRVRTAMAQYESLLKPPAPTRIRKEALVRCAVLDYKLGNYDRAADRLSSYIKRYPGDASAGAYVALAARTEISRGKYGAALRLFGSLHRDLDRGAGVEIDPKIIISEAALKFYLGDSTGAHRLLKRTIFSSALGWDREAYCYWLYRTSPTDSERSSWKGKLLSEYPGSIYGVELNDGVNAIIAGDDVSTRRARIWAMLYSERRFLDSLSAATPPDDSLMRDTRYMAYVYCLDRGFLPEAYACLSQVGPMVRGDAQGSFAVYKAARDRGLYWFSLRTLDVLVSIDISLRGRLRYPAAFADILAGEGVAAGLPPECVLGLIWVESRFNPSAVSVDGAVGLMQLLPSTARWVARRSFAQSAGREDLFDPQRNIELGCAYFQYLLDRFDGSLVGALAAYNGGETRMASWKKAFDPARDPMLAMELIGPPETRNYVQKVLESIRAYRAMLEEGTGQK